MRPWKIELPKLGNRTVRPVGVLGRDLYVEVRGGNRLELWSVNLFLPNSWRRRWAFDFVELIYAHLTTSADGHVYILFTGCIDDTDTVCLEVLAVTPGEDDYVRYKCEEEMDVMTLMTNYDLHPETDRLCAGAEDLYVTDRGIVQGPTPLLRLKLNHDTRTFKGTRETLPPANDATFSVFGGFLDVDKKNMVKLADSNHLHVFNQASGEWDEYAQDLDAPTTLNLAALNAEYKRIGVTYNERHLRTAMVQSPISLVTGQGQAVLLHKSNSRASFYSVRLDQQARTFKLRLVGRVNSLIRQSFNFCTSDAVIVLGRPSYVIWLRLLTLRELSYFKSQQICGEPTDDEPIRKKCKVIHNNALV